VSKLGCTCGNVIIDQTDDLPNKGRILKDQDKEKVFGEIASALAAYFAAFESGNLDEWLQQYPWAREKNHEFVIFGMVAEWCRGFAVDIYECEACGRLLVQEKHLSQQFVSYSPDASDERRLLASEFWKREE
jgi:hypothetical protein